MTVFFYAMKDPRTRGTKQHITAGFGEKGIDWASPKQEEAFLYKPAPLCCSGGFGSAKTYALCLKILWLCETFPKNRVLIARRVWEDLKKTTMQTFFKLCPPDFYNDGGKRSDSEKYLRLNNGSEILWMHMQDEDTENVLRGIEINAAFLDQAEEIEEGAFDILMSRLGRWDQAEVPQEVIDTHGGIDKWAWKNPVTGEPQVPSYMLLACNPSDLYHWIYRRFHPDSDEHWEKKIPVLETRSGKQKKDRKGNLIFKSYHDLGYYMIQMKSWENKYLPEHNLQEMMARDESFRKRYVEGEWGVTEGTIHKVDPLSIIETDPKADTDLKVNVQEFISYLQEHCYLFRVLDHGDSSPTCCGWFAVDREGNVFAFREYYQPNKLISFHRQSITALSRITGSEKAQERYRYNLADPSIFFKTQVKYGGRWSVADEYQDRRIGEDTILHWQPADNNELGTRNRISEYLIVDPERVHPITKTKGAPRLYFLRASELYPNGIRHILRELRAQTRVQIGMDNGRPTYSDDRDEKVPDHGYDVLRYFISSRPPVAVASARMPDPNSFKAVHEEMIRLDKQPQRLGYLARKMGERVGI